MTGSAGTAAAAAPRVSVLMKSRRGMPQFPDGQQDWFGSIGRSVGFMAGALTG